MLGDLLRSMFGPSTGQPGIRHYAQLTRDDDVWRLAPYAQPSRRVSAEVVVLPKLAFYADVKAACGAFDPVQQDDEPPQQIAVTSTITIDPKRHFVVTASGDSMDGGATPIADGSLVLCEWARGVSAESVEGKPFLLVGHGEADTTFAVMKVPRRTTGGWVLESWNPKFGPQKMPSDARLEPVARVVEVVERARGLVLWGEYDRDVIAAAFGSQNNPSWRVGHRDIDVLGQPHTVLMVTLRKASQTKVEHRYADCFLSRTEFQWSLRLPRSVSR